ncbi:hypothetical protein G7Y89_g14906 [Cudoniella acicularis]|uniref:Serine aminopeptidase S33 domain-containing protein n=1 Tax=Cudoniella acicularis TaxID=354080 RepID=A0A8H4QY17_9HELO|nr:hypothetical protein G7Y89_g14906 [Cudoniella acicularis]
MEQDGDQMANQENAPRSEDYSTQRLSQRYRFADPNMDLFFLGALGWGPAGGLCVGEAFHVATQIADGDVESWARAFERQGIAQNAQADVWQQRGWTRAAGETRLKAFASYRLAWQFVAPGERFVALYRTHQRIFDQAMTELVLPATSFTASDPSAPTVLVIGGADTCHEDRFLSQGRYFVDRGYSVALVDLPGQGLVQEQGLYWEVEAERPIAAVIDELIARFGVEPRKLALLGMSLGGYFACRAAAHEPRLAAVIATTPLPRPGELFARIAKQEAEAEADGATTSDAARKNRQVILWKAGVADISELIRRWDGMGADPGQVELPFLSIVGGQEGSVWKEQAKEWHEAIRSGRKSFVTLNAETGADVHCQGNNPLRLVQEVDGWLREVFKILNDTGQIQLQMGLQERQYIRYSLKDSTHITSVRLKTIKGMGFRDRFKILEDKSEHKEQEESLSQDDKREEEGEEGEEESGNESFVDTNESEDNGNESFVDSGEGDDGDGGHEDRSSIHTDTATSSEVGLDQSLSDIDETSNGGIITPIDLGHNLVLRNRIVNRTED